jgi:hypothetical protein
VVLAVAVIVWLLAQQILEVVVAEQVTVIQGALAVQALLFFATPVQFNISLVAQ